MSPAKVAPDLPDYARQSRLLSIVEVCKLLGNISRTTFYRWRKKHKLSIYPVGGKKCRYDEVIWLLEKIKE